MVSKAWVLPALLLSMVSIFPISAGKLKFIPIYKTILVKANKKLPPHIAYMDSHFDHQNTEWRDFDKKSRRSLGSDFKESFDQGLYILTQKRELEGFVIRKSVETLPLPTSERTYKTSVQAYQENQGPQWLKNIVREPSAPLRNKPMEDAAVHNLTAAKRVTGPIELTQGLAVTNEHHIEVRRADEGVFREMGQVDLRKGSYSIDIDEASGAIVARLIDKGGAILGEGSIRLSQLQVGKGTLIYGPRLEILPNPSWRGKVSYSQPKPSKGDAPGAGIHATTYGGQNPVTVGKNDEIVIENASKNSTTVVRSEVGNHMPSSKIMVVGSKPFEITNFPTSMMEALKSIVGEQRGIVASRLTNSSIVWGTVTLDGKPISGVTVVSETDPEAKTIYFNEFMIPDPKLTATSGSGLFAFLNLHDGFHALLAQRGNAYFGHQNVEVEVGSVAIGDIEGTLRTEPVRLRAYDAFSGEPATLAVNLQSLSEPVDITDGSASIVLPQVARLSMIYTEAPANYISANYFYNDMDSYIHLPMVSPEWLAQLKAFAKTNDIPNTGTIIGFFGEESFEAFLAGQAKDSTATIVYFDAAGKIVEGTQGITGGGFVIFNVPYGTQEAVLVGASEKIFSKVIPVEVDTVSVLTFNSY